MHGTGDLIAAIRYFFYTADVFFWCFGPMYLLVLWTDLSLTIIRFIMLTRDTCMLYLTYLSLVNVTYLSLVHVTHFHLYM